VIALALDLGATELEVSPQGIALVQRLLCEGASPVYAPLGPAALTQALRDAHAALLCGRMDARAAKSHVKEESR
jgi:hypothetical protein